MVTLSLLWVAFGCSNLLLRRGTAKGGFNDHPEEVAEFVKQTAGSDCSLVFVHDPALVYILNRQELPRTSTVSLFPDYIHRAPAGEIQKRCQPKQVFVVKSFAGWPEGIRSHFGFAEGRALAGLASEKVANFCRDPDAGHKRWLTREDDLPDYRFEVDYGTARPGVNWEDVARLYGSALSNE